MLEEGEDKPVIDGHLSRRMQVPIPRSYSGPRLELEHVGVDCRWEIPEPRTGGVETSSAGYSPTQE